MSGIYERYLKENIKYLDTLDLSEFIPKPGIVADVQPIIGAIAEKYDGSPDMPKKLQGFVFDWMDDEEVATYLAHRYGLQVMETVVTKFFLYNE